MDLQASASMSAASARSSSATITALVQCPRDALLIAEPYGDVQAVSQKLGAVAGVRRSGASWPPIGRRSLRMPRQSWRHALISASERLSAAARIPYVLIWVLPGAGRETIGLLWR